MTKDKETFKANRRSVENYMYIVMLSWMREMHEIVFGTHTHTLVSTTFLAAAVRLCN